MALVLIALITCAIGGWLWRDAQQTIVRQGNAVPATGAEQKASALTSPSRSAVPPIAPEAAPPANGLYRCQGPHGVLYQAEPCPGGMKQAAVAGGTVSVVSPPPVSVAPYAAPTRQASPRSVGLIERTPPDSTGNEYECEQLEKQIKRIDAEGRRGGTSWRMDQLREDRRKLKDAMWRLGCGR